MIEGGVIYLVVFAVLTLVLLVAISVLKNEKELGSLSKKVRKE